MNLLVGALAMGLVLSLLTLGVMVSFRILHALDLTTDGAFGLGAGITAALLGRSGVAPVTATAAAIAGGALAGVTTAVVHRGLRVNLLLAGVLTSTALYSVTLWVMGGGDLAVGAPTLFSAAEDAWTRTGAGAPLGVAAASWASLGMLAILVAAIALALRAFLGTRLGLALRAAGDGPAMAQAQGVWTGAMVAVGLGLANALVALGGALFAQYQGFANVQMAVGMFVSALACLSLGEMLFGGADGRWRIGAAIAGTLAFRLLIAAALRAGLDPNALKALTAAFVLASLALPDLVRRFRGRRTLVRDA